MALKIPDFTALGERDPRVSSRGIDFRSSNAFTTATAQFAATLQNAANVLRENKDESDAFATAQRYARFQMDWNEFQTETAQTMLPGGSGLKDSLDKEWVKRSEAFWRDVPDSLKEKYGVALIGGRTDLVKRATVAEMAERNRFAEEQIGIQQDALLETQRQNPDAWPGLRREGEDAIRNAPGLSPVEKETRRKAWLDRQALALFDLHKQADPDGARAAILPAPRGPVDLRPFLAKGKAPSHARFDPVIGPRLQAMLTEAQKAGHDIRIYSGHRSVERQKELWNAALRKYGSAEKARRWVAPPGSSRHNVGAAADLAFPTTVAREWAHDNAGRFGLNFRMSHEPWHIEADAKASFSEEQSAPSPNDTGTRPEQAPVAAVDPRYASLPYEKRVEMARRLDIEIENAEKQQAAMERAVEKEALEESKRVATDMMVTGDNDGLRVWLEENRDDLSPYEYRTYARALHKKGTTKTDEATYLRLDDLATESPAEALGEMRDAYLNDQISLAVFNRLRSKAERQQRDAEKRPWVKDLRGYVRRSLSFPDMTQNQRDRQLNAMFAFDDMIEANPQMSREEARKEADQVIQGFRRSRSIEQRGELPMPKFTTQARETYTLEAVQVDKQALLEKFQSGQLSRAEAEAEASRLMAWERSLMEGAEKPEQAMKGLMTPGVAQGARGGKASMVAQPVGSVFAPGGIMDRFDPETGKFKGR